MKIIILNKKNILHLITITKKKGKKKKRKKYRFSLKLKTKKKKNRLSLKLKSVKMRSRSLNNGAENEEQTLSNDIPPVSNEKSIVRDIPR